MAAPGNRFKYYARTLPLILLAGVGWYSLQSTDGYQNFASLLPGSGNLTGLAVVLAFSLLAVLVLAAVIYNFVFRRGVEGWSATQGRITRSQAAFKTERFGAEDPHMMGSDEAQVSNADPRGVRRPEISYEFEANGQKRSGSRIGLLQTMSNAETDRILTEYPVGKQVTVYFDPKQPGEALLEPESGRSPLWGLVTLAVICGLGWLFFSGGGVRQNPLNGLAQALPNAFIPGLVFASLFGLLLLIAFAAWLREYLKVAGFASTTGTITQSSMESFNRYHGRNTGLLNTKGRVEPLKLYRAIVEFTYTVAGRSFTSRSIRPSGDVKGPQEHIKSVLAKYPKGATVKVFHSKATPHWATLERTPVWGWALLAASLICFWLAWLSAGMRA